MSLFIEGKLFNKTGAESGGGGGGGDQHNLGWYATPTALRTAHPTANDGDWAIVGSTDTVWVWDSDSVDWVNTASSGLVTSVNSRTGDVVVLDNTAVSGTSLTLLGGASTYAYAVNIGHKSNETQDSSMVGVVALGYETESKGNGAIAIGGTASATYGGAKTNGTGAIAIGANTGSGLAGAKAIANEAIAIGAMAEASGVKSVGIGGQVQVSGEGSIAIGEKAKVTADNAALISTAESFTYTLAADDSLAFANSNGGYVLLDANGEIPSDRLVHAINKYSTMPTASSSNEGWIVQFTGTTDSTYTHGHLYECVSDGADPATYSWTEVSMGGGGSSYTAGTGIDITSGVISVTSPTLQNYTTATKALQVSAAAPSTISTGSWSTAIGDGAYAKGLNSIAIGRNTFTGTDTSGSIVIGNNSSVSNTHYGSIVIGGGGITSQGAGTFTVGLSANGGVGTWNAYKLLDLDGTIPTARLTKVNSIITLTAAGWSNSSQTVNVTGMTATGVVLVSPDPTDQADYTSAGIYCSAQAAGTLTFTCSTTPTNDIDVVVVML